MILNIVKQTALFNGFTIDKVDYPRLANFDLVMSNNTPELFYNGKYYNTFGREVMYVPNDEGKDVLRVGSYRGFNSYQKEDLVMIITYPELVSKTLKKILGFSPKYKGTRIGYNGDNYYILNTSGRVLKPYNDNVIRVYSANNNALSANIYCDSNVFDLLYNCNFVFDQNGDAKIDKYGRLYDPGKFLVRHIYKIRLNNINYKDGDKYNICSYNLELS